MPRKTLPALTSSQAPILAYVLRYKLLIADSIRVMLAADSEEAVEKSLKRLRLGGWLTQVQLPDRKHCYTLSREAVFALGLSKKAKRPMGQGGLIANLAALCFCARNHFERLTPEEVRERFPELSKPGVQVGYFFTDATTSPPRFTWMLIDRGSAPAVLVRKAGQVIKKLYPHPSMMQLMQAKQFAIAVLVPNERKKWLTDRVLAKRFFPNVAVSVHVVPEIQPLLLS